VLESGVIGTVDNISPMAFDIIEQYADVMSKRVFGGRSFQQLAEDEKKAYKQAEQFKPRKISSFMPASPELFERDSRGRV